eukprot:13091676-Alexandrium_andersonii.AAC.1
MPPCLLSARQPDVAGFAAAITSPVSMLSKLTDDITSWATAAFDQTGGPLQYLTVLYYLPPAQTDTYRWAKEAPAVAEDQKSSQPA